MGNQLVLIQIPGPVAEDDIVGLDEELQVIFADELPGEYDGYDYSSDGSGASLYFYGDDANALFMEIFPALAVRGLTRNARVTLRRGPADDPQAEELVFEMTDISVPGGDPP